MNGKLGRRLGAREKVRPELGLEPWEGAEQKGLGSKRLGLFGTSGLWRREGG